MWDIFAALTAVAKTAQTVLYRLWGTRTREQDRLERALDDALESKRHALALGLVDLANQYDAVARRVRNEIAAKFSK